VDAAAPADQGTSPEIETAEEEPAGPARVLAARGLGLRTRRGWVFRDLDLDVHAGDLIVLTGAAGSGRTSALLALAGRFAITDGTVERAGGAALGLVPRVHEPEPMLTVGEHIAERLRLHRPLRWPTARRREQRRRARELAVTGLPMASNTLARDLDPLHRHLLMLRLALLADPAIVAVDDVESGLSAAESTTLWAELRRLADCGVAVLATARETTLSGPVLQQTVAISPFPGHGSAQTVPGMSPSDEKELS
jgi:ABC-2 type transport system ATP-binding protein